jgi:hypothetical protein
MTIDQKSFVVFLRGIKTTDLYIYHKLLVLSAVDFDDRDRPKLRDFSFHLGIETVDRPR